MTDAQPVDQFSVTAENQRYDLINHFDDEFDLHFSFDDLFSNEQDIKDDDVLVEILDCAVNHESGDRCFDSLVGDWSRNTGDVSRASSSEGSGNAASGSEATDVSDLRNKVEEKYMSKRKKESEDEKRKARNREIAQMSRERKKRYVEELESKIRVMHATITDLNCKFAYLMAENASLRQQIGGGVMFTPVPGASAHRPMVPMGYPWMPSLPYAVSGPPTPSLPVMSLKPQKSVNSKNSNGTESGNKKTEINMEHYRDGRIKAKDAR